MHITNQAQFDIPPCLSVPFLSDIITYPQSVNLKRRILRFWISWLAFTENKWNTQFLISFSPIGTKKKETVHTNCTTSSTTSQWPVYLQFEKDMDFGNKKCVIHGMSWKPAMQPSTQLQSSQRRSEAHTVEVHKMNIFSTETPAKRGHRPEPGTMVSSSTHWTTNRAEHSVPE